MANSTLHLIVEKGPKKGETLERKPGTLIRIGRVVKGNTFTIKDPAISQNHLSIEFIPEISRWAVKDLDTSNGTFMNDIKIPSSVPYPLSDGDTIKIGEKTSISVKIAGDGEIEGGLRRGRSRGMKTRAESLDSVVEEENCEQPKRNVRKGRGRTKKAADSVSDLKKDEILESVVEDGIGNNLGRGRRGNLSRVSKKDEILDSVVEDRIEVPKDVGRLARAMVSNKDEVLDLIVEDSIEVPKKVGRGRPRRALARTRASSARVSTEEELPEVAGKEKLNVEDSGVDEGKLVGSGEEGELVRDAEERVDIENITLGEWFDSMEKFLPQAINDVAEDIISSLREKAWRFDEFIAKGSLV